MPTEASGWRFRNEMTAPRVAPGVVVSIRLLATTSCGPRPIAHRNFVPPPSTAPRRAGGRSLGRRTRARPREREAKRLSLGEPRLRGGPGDVPDAADVALPLRH